MTNTEMQQGASKTVTLLPLDGNGNPGVIAGTPTVVSTDTTVVVIGGHTTDGLQWTIAAQNKPGTTTCTALGADPNSSTFNSTFVVVVDELPATHFDFNFS